MLVECFHLTFTMHLSTLCHRWIYGTVLPHLAHQQAAAGHSAQQRLPVRQWLSLVIIPFLWVYNVWHIGWQCSKQRDITYRTCSVALSRHAHITAIVSAHPICGVSRMQPCACRVVATKLFPFYNEPHRSQALFVKAAPGMAFTSWSPEACRMGENGATAPGIQRAK